MKNRENLDLIYEKMLSVEERMDNIKENIADIRESMCDIDKRICHMNDAGSRSLDRLRQIRKMLEEEQDESSCNADNVVRFMDTVSKRKKNGH